jgi:2-keto-4-pentenoate hydratase
VFRSPEPALTQGVARGDHGSMTTTQDHAATERLAALTQAAERLTRAQMDRSPCAPVRDLITAADIDLAYAVQRHLTDRRTADGARVLGRKIGLTSVAVQEQLGVDRPDFGVLFDDMDVSSLAEVPSDRLLQPKVEAEIAFVLGADLDSDDIDVEVARASIAYAVAALEIVDSRIAGWDITITDTIADNASSGLFVLGSTRLSLVEFDPADVSMTLYVDDQQVSAGNGTACLGDPLNALVWLARTARAFGESLRAGQVVLSGALGPMAVAPPGSSVRAELSHLGDVSARFSALATEGD